MKVTAVSTHLDEILANTRLISPAAEVVGREIVNGG